MSFHTSIPSSSSADAGEPDRPDGAALPGAAPVAPPAKPAAGSVHHLMPLYYGRLFPLGPLCDWLSYGHPTEESSASDVASARAALLASARDAAWSLNTPVTRLVTMVLCCCLTRLT